MAERTVKDLVGDITLACAAQGMDLSPKDVGFIISTFIEGCLVGDPLPPEFCRQMQAIADEAANVRDE